MAMTTGMPRSSSMTPTTAQRYHRAAVMRVTASSVPMTSEKTIARAAAFSVFCRPSHSSRQTCENSGSFGSKSGAHSAASNWPCSSRRR